MDKNTSLTHLLILFLIFAYQATCLLKDQNNDLQDEDAIKNPTSHSDVTVTDGLCVQLRSGQITQQQEMESCFQIGYKFLRKYIRLTRIKKANGNNKCSLFNRFRSCFLSIYDKCSHNRTVSSRSEIDLGRPITHQTHLRQPNHNHDFLEIWRDVIDHVQCLCNPKSDCNIDPSCIFKEVDGFWGRRCDDFYKFNVEQKTRDICYFFEENIQCTTALVRTGCNSESERYARDLLYLISGNETHRLQCSRSHSTHTYKVFTYTENCRPSLIQEIDNCSALFTSQNIVEFYEDNDLIPSSNKRSLKTACRTVEKFTSCLEPLRNKCPEAVQSVLDYQEDLRRYLLKMNYICNQAVYPEFKQNLQCYQTLMQNSTLTLCSQLWLGVRPWQQNVTAYEFYCQPKHENTINLISHLKLVGDCHDAVYSLRCGQLASEHMRTLFNLAFSDPFYLRLVYKPDCSLHGTHHHHHHHHIRDPVLSSPSLLAQDQSTSSLLSLSPSSVSWTVSNSVDNRQYAVSTSYPNEKSSDKYVTVSTNDKEALLKSDATVRLFYPCRTLYLTVALIALR